MTCSKLDYINTVFIYCNISIWSDSLNEGWSISLTQSMCSVLFCIQQTGSMCYFQTFHMSRSLQAFYSSLEKILNSIVY